MKVLLTREAFLGILAASLEAYKRESIGFLFGSKGKKIIAVKSAFPPQTAKRFYASAEISTKTEKRLVSIFEHYAHMKLLGFFHSHPEYGDTQGEIKLSNADMRSLKNNEIVIVIAINESSKSDKWKVNSDDSISGTVDQYLFSIAAYIKDQNKDGQAMMSQLKLEIKGLLFH